MAAIEDGDGEKVDDGKVDADVAQEKDEIEDPRLQAFSGRLHDGDGAAQRLCADLHFHQRHRWKRRYPLGNLSKIFRPCQRAIFALQIMALDNLTGFGYPPAHSR